MNKPHDKEMHVRPFSERWFRWSLTGSVLSIALATACCWLPFILLIAGVGSLGFARTLTAYRPYFYTIAFVALGYAFYFTYRHRTEEEEACCVGETDETSKKKNHIHRASKWALWIVTALLIGSLFLPQWMDKTLMNIQASSEDFSAEGNFLFEFTITGMDCASCAAGLQISLKNLPGVLDAQVNYPEGHAILLLRKPPDNAFLDKLAQKIKEMGYGIHVPE